MAWSESGRALPPFAYLDDAVFEAERELLLRDWFMVGRLTDFSPGDYQSLEIAGQPILIWCGKDGEIRGFENVCRHRMAILAEGAGKGNHISCPFHGWTYASTGQLRAAPLLDNSQIPEIHLPEFRIEIWQGFVFVCCNPDTDSIGPRLRGIGELTAPHEISQFTFSFVQHNTSIVNANWKLVMEIGLESYHFPFVHRGTLAPRLKGIPGPPGNGAWTVSVEPRKKPLPERDDEPDSLTASQRETTYTFGIFPNTVFNIDVDNVVWFSVLPIDKNRSKVLYGVAARNKDCVRPLGATEVTSIEEYQNWGDQLGAEDNRMSERVQSGLRGRHAWPGLLVKTAEPCLLEMQRYLEANIPGYPEITR